MRPTVRARLDAGLCERCCRKRNPRSKRYCDFHLDYLMLRQRKRNSKKPTGPRYRRTVNAAAGEAIAKLSTALELCKRAGIEKPEIRWVIKRSIGSLYRKQKERLTA